MEINKIYQGDSLEVLKTFPDESVNCCVTSPPYYGLRDYGTANWSGGREDCDHIEHATNYNKGFNERSGNGDGTAFQKQEVKSFMPYKKECKKCGAVRIDSQIGLEETPELYVAKMVEVFAEVKRVLKKDGTLWINLGDSYNGSITNRTGQNGYNDGRENRNKRFSSGGISGLKPKDLIGIPWLTAFALRSAGWYLRQDIIWHKPNPMPESVTDRCTKSHEYIFLLSKSQKYYYDAEAIKDDAKPEYFSRYESAFHTGKKEISGNGRVNNACNTAGLKPVYEKSNKRSVWTVNTHPYSEAHFATFPQQLITDMIKAGCPENGIVLDPFSGAGTTALVAAKLNRNFVGIELNQDYIKIAEQRLKKELGMFNPSIINNG